MSKTMTLDKLTGIALQPMIQCTHDWEESCTIPAGMGIHRITGKEVASELRRFI